MKGRSWAVLALLMASSAGLAGCIEGLQSLSEDEKGITAREDLDLAANSAAAWNPQAYLVGVLSVETQDARSGLPADVEVGDGRTPFWYYAYGAPDANETRMFRVTADGRVTTEERLPGMLGMVELPSTAPLGAWSLDSDAAVAAARGHEDVAAVFAGANLSIMEGLAHHPETAVPTWVVVGFSEAGFVVARVDPETGAVEIEELDMLETPMPMPMPVMPAFSFAPPIVIEDEGTLEGDELERSYTFEAQEGMTGYLRLDASTYQMFDTFGWYLMDPEGEVVGWDTLRSWSPAGSSFEQEFEFEAGMSGEYTFLIQASNTVGPLATPLPPQPVDFWFELTVGHGVAAPEPDEDDD